jgi:hypothetical protein
MSLTYFGKPPSSASIDAWFQIIVVALLMPLVNVERKTAVLVDQSPESFENFGDQFAFLDFDPKAHWKAVKVSGTVFW